MHLRIFQLLKKHYRSHSRQLLKQTHPQNLPLSSGKTIRKQPLWPQSVQTPAVTQSVETPPVTQSVETPPVPQSVETRSVTQSIPQTSKTDATPKPGEGRTVVAGTSSGSQPTKEPATQTSTVTENKKTAQSSTDSVADIPIPPSPSKATPEKKIEYPLIAHQMLASKEGNELRCLQFKNVEPHFATQ